MELSHIRLIQTLAEVGILTGAGNRLYLLPTVDAIVEMVRGGMGVAVLNHMSVRSYLKSPGLRGIRVTENGFRRMWYTAALRGEHHTAYVQRFVDNLVRHGEE